MAPDVSCPDSARLAALRSGQLTGEEREEVAVHVAACPRCARRLAESGGLPGSGSATADAGAETLAKAAPAELPLTRTDAQNASPPSSVRKGAPSCLGPYQLVRELGRGGMGAVYLAVHTLLKKRVAVEVLPASRTDDPEAVARFRREMEALGGLAHANVVSATDAGVDGDIYYLVMEYVEGIDLAAVARLCGRLSVADAAEVIRQAAVGLQYVHETGRVHRDVKPSNLMLSAAGEVKVLDLGLALLHHEHGGEELTASGEVMGTIDYMAPEQWLDSHRVDIRADIYSLGCTLYKLLAGKPPFGGSTAGRGPRQRSAHAETPAPPILDRDDLPEALSAALARMLCQAPDDRFRTPAEVADAMRPFTAACDLRRLVEDARQRRDGAPEFPPADAPLPARRSGTPGGATPRETQPPPAAPPSRRPRRWAVALAVGLAVTAALATVLALAFWRPAPTGPGGDRPPAPPDQGAGRSGITPFAVLWPADARNSEWHWDDRRAELRVQCDGDGLVGLGAPAVNSYEIQVDLYQTQWGDAGIFFGRHPERLDGKAANAYHLIALVRDRNKEGQEQFFLQWREHHRLPDGGGGISERRVAPVPIQGRDDQALSITVTEGRLSRVGWNGADMLPALLATPSPTPQLLPTGADCTGVWGAYASRSTAYFRNPQCLSPR